MILQVATVPARVFICDETSVMCVFQNTLHCKACLWFLNPHSLKMSNNQSNPSSHTTGKVHDNLAIILNPNGTITRIGPNPIALATPDPNSSSPVLTKDLPLNPHHNTWVRIFMPRQALDAFSSTTKYTKLPLIVYFHGGGFILYSAASTFFHNFCVEMTIQAGVAIVSVEHRLAPEHRLPAAYDDAMDALHWIRTSQDVWLRDIIDITRCFIMGTSSGGNIAYHAGLRAASEVSDLAPLKIGGLVLHEPAFGGTERSGSELRLINDPILPMFLLDLMWELALPIGAGRDHKYCNPTVDSESSWEKMRQLGWRVMVVGYEGDPMVDRQMELGKGLKKKGVEVVAEFSKGEYHGVTIREHTKAKPLFALIRKFVHGCPSAL